MQNWTLSELDSGERVITERLDHVRSVAVGYWIGAGARDETPEQAGVTHFIEHLLFKGSKRFDALEIAEIFDGLGGELNAATSREHTLIYSRVPDNHLETALDVMGDMVFAPVFEELDAEREVVLEEIAMYEDTPQELVHDLIAEAVFGDHPLGRPVIGTADVISSIPRDAIAGYHDEMYTPAQHRRGRGRQRRARARRRARLAGAGAPRRGGRLGPRTSARRSSRHRRPDCGSSARTPSSTTSAWRLPASPAPTAAASPPRSSTRSSAGRPRPGSSRRSARSGGWRTRSTRSPRSTPTRARSASTSARREDNLAEALAIAADQIADVASGNVPDRELNRAKENLKGRILLSMESTSARMNRLGKSLITDSELLSLERLVAEVDAVEAVVGRRARRRAARAGAPLGRRHRARRGASSWRRSRR